MEDLNEEEKALFYYTSLENLFYSANATQKDHEEKSKSRAILERLEPLISAVDQYSAALDVYSNTYSLAIAPLWGSIRVLLHVCLPFMPHLCRSGFLISCHTYTIILRLRSLLGSISKISSICSQELEMSFQDVESINHCFQVMSIYYTKFRWRTWTS
jgi:hypothetical protein